MNSLIEHFRCAASVPGTEAVFRVYHEKTYKGIPQESKERNCSLKVEFLNLARDGIAANAQLVRSLDAAAVRIGQRGQNQP